MKSLHSRAVLSGTIWAAAALVMAGLVFASVFDDLVKNQFEEDLLIRHTAIVTGLAQGQNSPNEIDLRLKDPSFAQPFSGRYWQIRRMGEMPLTSRSLVSQTLPEPVGETSDPSFWTTQVPGIGRVRGVTQKVVEEDGTIWYVANAETTDKLDQRTYELRTKIFAATSMIVVFGAVGAVFLTSAALGPIRALHAEVANRWEDNTLMREEKYPSEVVPLVSDINALLERNRDLVSRAQRSVGDMAHALKTPTAILINSLDEIARNSPEHNATVVTQAREAADRIEAQITRYLARVRAANFRDLSGSGACLANSMDRLERLFNTTQADTGKILDNQVGEGLLLAVDPQDLEETLGNLLENAFAFCRSRVQVTATRHLGMGKITVEDDGEGIAAGDHDEALRSGGRLAQDMPGTGLGLAIASDLADAYGGTLTLKRSDALGGLKVVLELPLHVTSKPAA